MLLLKGVIAGVAAGILMGLLSHAGFKNKMFRSSLFIIDGSFIQKFLHFKHDEKTIVLFGIPVHLLTSVSFGVGYVVPISILNLDLLNGWLIALYVFILWLSMLFVALPVAGQGFLGKKIGSHTWIEQLLLHMVFGIGLWGALRVLS